MQSASTRSRSSCTSHPSTTASFTSLTVRRVLIWTFALFKQDLMCLGAVMPEDSTIASSRLARHLCRTSDTGYCSCILLHSCLHRDRATVCYPCPACYPAPEAKARTAALATSAASDRICFYLVGFSPADGIPQEDIDRAFAHGTNFFNLPEEVKARSQVLLIASFARLVCTICTGCLAYFRTCNAPAQLYPQGVLLAICSSTLIRTWAGVAWMSCRRCLVRLLAPVKTSMLHPMPGMCQYNKLGNSPTGRLCAHMQLRGTGVLVQCADENLVRTGTKLWEWLSLGYDRPENTSAKVLY